MCPIAFCLIEQSRFSCDRFADLALSDRARLKELERENQELKAEGLSLKKQ